MKQITLELVANQMRPIIKMDNVLKFNALLDTGAAVPVWTHDENFLKAIGGIKIRNYASFKGFGGSVRGPLYHFPAFTVGELTFPHLPVIVHRMDEPFHMLLSASMFTRLIYEIDDYHHKLNITVPDGESLIRNITDRDDNGRLKIVLVNEIT